MKKILISDTHYGVKNNSVTWLKYQMEFIYKQLIPYINKLKSQGEVVRLYHLGDVFDSRSSINPMVASTVIKAMNDLSRIVDELIVIGGNHDYYSPVDDGENVNSLQLLLNKDITLITNELYVKDDELFVPWFEYGKTDKLDQYIKQYNIKNIYCHADLPHISPLHKVIFRNCNVYSGHIHTPEMNGNLHTLGSTYALTFADCNSERGFYVLDDELVFIPNTYSIKFYRFKNDEIFNVLDTVNKDDYVELYVDHILLLNDDYVNQIKEITKFVHNTNVIPVSQLTESTEQADFDNYNIETMCKENIPEELMDKFETILERAKDE